MIVIIGSRGQLGTELRHQHEDGRRPVVAVDIDGCDITDAASVNRFFADLPRAKEGLTVINCAAFTAVDAAEDQRAQAMAVNARGAGLVAAACRAKGARLIHVSTDFVFGPGFEAPIGELAPPRPLSVYGASKLSGERLALQNNPTTAVVRTSGLYSPWGPNFVRTIAKAASQKDALSVVADQIISPTPVEPLAKVLLTLADWPLFVGGVYHATAHGGCSWCDFATAIVELLDLDTTVSPTTAVEWGARAQRPDYSVLDNERLRTAGLDEFRGWRQELELFIAAYGDIL